MSEETGLSNVALIFADYGRVMCGLKSYLDDLKKQEIFMKGTLTFYPKGYETSWLSESCVTIVGLDLMEEDENPKCERIEFHYSFHEEDIKKPYLVHDGDILNLLYGGE